MRADPGLGVFDTLLVVDGRPVELTAHHARLAHSVGVLYDEAIDVAERISAAAAGVALGRLRTTYVPGSGATIAVTALTSRPSGVWRLVPLVLPGGWGEHKWVDRHALASPAWDASTDPLILDTDGSVLETGRGNVFAVLDGVVVTPPLDGRILPGVTRAGIDTEERPLTLHDLGRAERVFVTNAIGGVRPVGSIEGTRDD